jgi:hypothetical protein
LAIEMVPTVRIPSASAKAALSMPIALAAGLGYA